MQCRKKVVPHQSNTLIPEWK